MTETLIVEAEAPAKWTASEMQRRLAARYHLPQWAYFAEVRDSSGFNATRSADGVAFDTWKGHAIHGFEIKVSRTDWLRELQQPGKCEAVGQYCDYWWVVAAPGVVRAGELPPQWGLLLPNGDGLRAEKAAPKRAEVAPISRAFVALLFRRACEASPSVVAIEAARNEGIAIGRRQAEVEGLRDPNVREVTRLRERIESFEKRAGVSIDTWDVGSIAEAVAVVRADRVAMRRQDAIRESQRLAEMLERMGKALRDDIAALAVPTDAGARRDG